MQVRRDETPRPRCLPWKPDSASVGCFRPSTHSSTVLWLQLAVHHLTHSKPVGVTASPVKFSIPRHIGLLGPWHRLPHASLFFHSHRGACTVYSAGAFASGRITFRELGHTQMWEVYRSHLVITLLVEAIEPSPRENIKSDHAG
jgi:hypothetical protein